MSGTEVSEAAQKADLDKTTRHILMMLAFLAGTIDVVLISERGLAQKTGYSRSTVWNRLHRLEDLGWLRRERLGKQTMCTLLIPEAAR